MLRLIALLALAPSLACWTVLGPRELCGIGSVDPACHEAGPAPKIEQVSLDAGSADAGSADAGSADAGSADAGSADAGSADAEAPPSVCGDGSVSGDEDCDDGNQQDTDACTNACQYARCGDGIVRADVDRGSANQCFSEEFECPEGERCFRDYSIPEVDGYGYCHPVGYEECDDGNDNSRCYDSCLRPSD